MRQPDLKKWHLSDELEGLLFFALLVDELLFDYTIDTFKIPAMNTKTILYELKDSISEIEKGVLKKAVSKPIIDELCANFEKDPIIKNIFRFNCGTIANELCNQQNIEGLKNIIDYIIKKIEPLYFSTCKSLLAEKVKKSCIEKETITRLTRIYLNELIIQGYESSHIYYENQAFFFGRYPGKIDSVDQINQYFARFNGESRKWISLFRVSGNFKLIEKFLPAFSMSINDKRPAFTSAEYVKDDKDLFNDNEKFPLYLTIENIETLDPEGARSLSEGKLSLIDTLSKYHIHREDLSWLEKALVCASENSYSRICSPPKSPILKIKEKNPQKLADFVAETVSTLTSGNLKEESFSRLISALGLHRMALISPQQKDQLINFWVAIEILFPSKIEEPSARIEKIVTSLVPFITKSYVGKLSGYVCHSIRSCDTRGINIISNLEIEGNLIDKCAALISIDEYKDMRKEIYALFAKQQPLLKNRIYYLHGHLNSAESILRLLNNHIKRIGWHIRRIYRARNLIVHSGKTSEQISILIENLHTYLDRTFEIIHSNVAHSDAEVSIEDITLENMLSLKEHMRFLKKNKDEKCTKENFKKLLYGN